MKFEGKTNFLGRENIRLSAENERSTISLQEAEIESARIQFLWEDMQKTWDSWWCIAEEMHPTVVGSGETSLLATAHTAEHTHTSLLYEVSPSGAQFLLSCGVPEIVVVGEFESSFFHQCEEFGRRSHHWETRGMAARLSGKTWRGRMSRQGKTAGQDGAGHVRAGQPGTQRWR